MPSKCGPLRITQCEIDEATAALKLQCFWPHQDDIAEDAQQALKVIAELQLHNQALSERNRALEVTLDRITEKDNWEILIDMQRDQFKVRKAFKTVIKQLDDFINEVA